MPEQGLSRIGTNFSIQTSAKQLINIIKEKANGKIFVTVGEKEKAVMRKSAMVIVKSNPNCKGIILSNVGHGIAFANPIFFNQMIEAWILEGNVPKEGIISL